jgi:pentatricopeptide repeat protein
MSGILGWLYAQAGLADEAERIAAAASRLAANSELAALTEVNRAAIEAALCKHDAAEARLRDVVKRELPASESRMTSDIVLVAPLKLADLLRERGRHDEAELLYKELVERGLEWDREHPENAIGGSYATAACRGRLQSAIDRKGDVEASLKTIMDEIEGRLPAAAGELRDEFWMTQGRKLPGWPEPPHASEQSDDDASADVER